MNQRQEDIMLFAQAAASFQTKNVMDFLQWSHDVERITIIRDLSELVSQWLLVKEWQWRAVRYSLSANYSLSLPIDREKYFDTPYQEREISLWFNHDIFDRLSDDMFSHKETEHMEELHYTFIKNISSYDSQTIINKEYQRIIIEFAWKSSAIEWNTYSLLNTEALINENTADDTKTEAETQMILNHKDVFNETMLNRDRFLELKLWDIEYIHTILTKKLWVTTNIRKSGVWITGTSYKPLGNEFQIREVLEKMVMLINQKKNFFEKAFIVLILLSYTQAFEDWNKRTARMTSNAILLAHWSIPLSYRIVNIVEYKKACILFYEQNNISYFKQIFIEQIQDAVENYFVT